MANTILLLLTEGFDDMAYLSNQVILEEAGNDVITASHSSGAIKGATSSVMTVSIDEALSQDISYKALILIGGDNLTDIPNLVDIITQFKKDNKIIGAIGSGVDVLASTGEFSELSSDSEIIVSNHTISMKIPKNSEEFAEQVVSLL